jgi:hypothetical protein
MTRGREEFGRELYHAYGRRVTMLVPLWGRNGKLSEKPKVSGRQIVRRDMRKKGGMRLTIRPVTPDLWLALEDLFLASGVPATAVGACIGDSEVPIAGGARKTKRRYERS